MKFTSQPRASLRLKKPWARADAAKDRWPVPPKMPRPSINASQIAQYRKTWPLDTGADDTRSKAKLVRSSGLEDYPKGIGDNENAIDQISQKIEEVSKHVAYQI